MNLECRPEGTVQKNMALRMIRKLDFNRQGKFCIVKDILNFFILEGFLVFVLLL